MGKGVKFGAMLMALALLGACSSTWGGVKEDTRDNVKAVGQGVQKAGEKIEKQAE